ncbi:MAG TPA: hypothetical protein VF811_05485 [Parasulfuritortus sp.]
MNAPAARRLLAVLASTLVLGGSASDKPQTMGKVPAARAQVVHLAASRERKAVQGLAEMLPAIQRSRLNQADPPAPNLFTQKSWYVPPPPPPPPKPLPPPPPTAPPLPFGYMGSYEAPNGPLIIFLTKGDQLYTVSPGDVIEGIYRVEGISAGRLGLTYLPLNIRQSLPVGGVS